MLKFDKLVHYGTLEVAELFKSTSRQIQDGGQPQIFSLNIALTQPRIV